jgi:hypothetical protein
MRETTSSAAVMSFTPWRSLVAARHRGRAIVDSRCLRICAPVLAVGVVVVAALLLPARSQGNVGGVRDPRDAGTLDIRRAGYGHAGATSVTQTLATYERFRSRLLRGERSIAFALLPRSYSYPDYWVFVSWEAGSLRAALRDNDGKVIGPLHVSRPSSSSVKVVIPKALFGSPPAYRWIAFTTSRAGFDATREGHRFPTGARYVRGVVHDYTAPDIRLISFPELSTDVSATLAYPVTFHVRDVGFAGIRIWRIDRRRLGGIWRTVAHGRRAGSKRRVLTGLEGKSYEHRVVAVDRQGNRAQSPVAPVTSLPLDDANPAFADSFQGAWSVVNRSSGDFLGTLHASSEVGASFSYGFSGASVAWIAPASAGSASVQIDAGSPEAVDLAASSGHRQVVFRRDLAPGEHTITISVTGGTVALDGLAVRGPTTVGGVMRPLDADGLQLPRSAEAPRWPALAGRFAYADSWRGWPVAPIHAQHPIRGSFLDPRPGGFHFGIDINVRDDRRETGAPAGRTHRVYAVEGGVARDVVDSPGSTCGHRSLGVGHFFYQHVDSVVRAGQRVRPGTMIGWTCSRQWHVHLSEWALSGGRNVLVNPLHPGGKLAPYADTAPPVIHAVRFFSPAGAIWILPGGAMWSPVMGRELAADRLRGLIDARAWISDPQSFHGWFDKLPSFYADHLPTRVRIRVVRAGDGRVMSSRMVFDGRVFLYGMRLSGLYGMGTMQNLSAKECYRISALAQPPRECQGRYWLHLFTGSSRSYWDTRTLPNGFYRLRITAWDALGHAATKSVPVRIAN